MDFLDLIVKKRNGAELTESEIDFFVKATVDGSIPDYQISAFLMAVVFVGMSEAETAALTMAMAHSGDTVDLSDLPYTVDKHSTGGVGDKTSLVVGPIAAACGLTVAKMSGRGLGHTGGTIDKLESIPGLRTEMTKQQFLLQAKEIGLVIAGQSGDLAPADKKLYALRDVTGTVQSLPLIVSSIMSKKLASGAKSIVLDVKTGSGAFMKTLAESEHLARAMVNIGNACGRRVNAVITDMGVPLGACIGNSLEIEEAMQVLRGEGPKDLREICLVLAANLVRLALDMDEEQAMEKARWALDGSYAAERFGRFVVAQGAEKDPLSHPEILPRAQREMILRCPTEGYIHSIDALACGNFALSLGAGRKTKTDSIDYSAGIRLAAKPGDYVKQGDVLATVYANKDADLAVLADAYRIGFEKPALPPLVYKTVL